jgi:hypothetical protein
MTTDHLKFRARVKSLDGDYLVANGYCEYCVLEIDRGFNGVITWFDQVPQIQQLNTE